MNKWTEKNILFLNEKETEVVVFGTRPKISQLSRFCIYIGTYQLTRGTEFKYFGIIVDDSLRWNAHVKHLVVKEWGCYVDCEDLI